MRRFKAGDAVAGLSPAVAPTDKSAFQCVRDADGACGVCD